MRLFTRNGHDWTDRYPAVELVRDRWRGGVAGRGRVSDFDGLHSRQHDSEVQLYAFDCLALDGDDLRKLRKLAPNPISQYRVRDEAAA